MSTLLVDCSFAGEGIRAKEPEDAEKEVLALRAELEGLEGAELEAKFSELASVHSDDAPPVGTEQPAGALPIGHLGWFGSGQMARPFEEATAVRRCLCVHPSDMQYCCRKDRSASIFVCLTCYNLQCVQRRSWLLGKGTRKWSTLRAGAFRVRGAPHIKDGNS